MGCCNCKDGNHRPSMGLDLESPLLAEIPDDTLVLRMKLYQAKDVPPHDLTGKSDPYFKFRLTPDQGDLGNQKKKSSAKWRTLDPSWEPEEYFDFVLIHPERARLIISLYDKDMIRTDEPLGDALVSIGKVLKNEEEWMGKKWLNLSDPNSGNLLKTCVQISIEIMSKKRAFALKEHTVYEYQRWQPITDWGSDYPGHLLPTDPGKYSSADGKNWGMTFDEVAPKLSKGSKELQGWSYMSTKGDPQGWKYSMGFVAPRWFDEMNAATTVRRRLWRRVIEEGDNEETFDLVKEEKKIN